MVFTKSGHGGHLGKAPEFFKYTLVPPSYRRFIQALIGRAVSEEKRFEYYGNIHVYCPGVGADEPLQSIFSESLIFSPTAHFLQDFSL